jgi:putative peptidoglycan lipid II flippase
LWKAAFIVFIGELCQQGYALTERSFASDLGTGNISAFFYAWALVNIPLALVVMPVSNVAYPQLALAFNSDRRKGLKLLYRHGGFLIFYGVLIAIGLSWWSEWIVRLVFLRGKFTPNDAQLTGDILSVLVFALPFMCFGRLIRYSLFSLSNYAAPSLALFLNWAVITGLAWLLTPRYGIEGLAYASVASASIEPSVMLLALICSLRWTAQDQTHVLSAVSED